MKILLTNLIFSFSCFLTLAQQNHFIYLQTENKQSFFVKIEDKVFNSSDLGYLIIPRLQDGLYSLVIGFPQSTSQQVFNCTVHNKDLGFIIKNDENKNWQLLNMQSFNIIVPGEVLTKKNADTLLKETDSFSRMLAAAVNDSTILQKDVVKETLPEKTAPALQKDRVQILIPAKDVAVNEPLGKKKIKKYKNKKTETASLQKNKAKKIAEEKSQIYNDSTQVFVKSDSGAITKQNQIDKLDEAKETLTKKSDSAQSIIANNKMHNDSLQNVISISENSKPIVKQKIKKKKNIGSEVQKQKVKETEVVKLEPPKVDTTQTVIEEKKETIHKSIIKRKLKKITKNGLEMIYVDDSGNEKDTIRLLISFEKKQKDTGELKIETVVVTPIEDKGKNENKITTQETQIIKEANVQPALTSKMINSDCKSFATDVDFLKLRKKMVAENNDEDMINVAKKSFKIKCFTTEQIKNLSTLFLKDQGKYIFFDTAYPFVSDTDLYAILESQLSDVYYITRFRAMIHK